MFIGHFAVAFAAKKVAPRASLGTLVLSAQFLDLLWPMFLLIGAEHVRIDPGNTAFTPLDFYDYPISHSLLTTVGWAVILGGIYYILKRDARTSLVLYGLAVSHWMLDALTHRPDLPLLPWFDAMVGLGLWESVAWTVVTELLLLAGGVMLFLGVRKAEGRPAGMFFWSYVAFLAFVWAANIFGPPPPSEDAIGIVGMSMWLLVAWAYWIDRRPLTEGS
jgi:hypothetical protein